ncbi:MAG: 5'/3'-nucleotidase SurE [Phycisphaerales bacterium]|nr:5'/3'-nucleotidase SurE [Phycisphaerales bacterium]
MKQHSDKKLILVSNDDGIFAPGLKLLVNIIKPIADVVVVAPLSPQSGKSHAVTLHKPLRITKNPANLGVPNYACSGTPTDCVKIALSKLLKKKPDICLSGINNGGNEGIAVFYSATMSVAMESGIEGIPAAGISSYQALGPNHIDSIKYYILKIVSNLLDNKLDKHLVLNVNIPTLPIKGIRLCHQADAKYEEQIMTRKDPKGKEYYWLHGFMKEIKKNKKSDINALSNSYISVVPILLNLTNYTIFDQIKEKWQL